MSATAAGYAVATAGAGMLAARIAKLPGESLPEQTSSALGPRLLSPEGRCELEQSLSFALATYEKPPVHGSLEWVEVASEPKKNVRAVGRLVTSGEAELGFRGSVFAGDDGATNLANWTNLNANIRPVAIHADVRPLGSAAPKGVLVHEGFLTAYLCVRDACCAWLQEIAVGVGARVRVCGHSLGGAIATLCALDLSLQGYSVQLITWGGPRVGNLAFAQFFRDKIRDADMARFVTGGDPVTRLPLHRSPLHPLTNFSHVYAASRVDAPRSATAEAALLEEAILPAEAEALDALLEQGEEGDTPAEPLERAPGTTSSSSDTVASMSARGMLATARRKIATLGSGAGSMAALPKKAVEAHLLLTGYAPALSFSPT